MLSKLTKVSLIAAVSGAVSAFLLTWWFHLHSALFISLFTALSFSVVTFIVAYGLTFICITKRNGIRKPVPGALRGAALGMATFIAVVILHTAIFPGNGGFLFSVLPILGIGLSMFGWAVAIIGSCIGMWCERRYLA
jgi:hypothetical protein